jgi:phage gp36-like protein
MSAFITTTDYDAAIHSEILDALTRDDDAVIEIAEDTAIEEMKGYMAKRYDCDVIFAKTGSQRSQLVVMMAIDITLYHLHSASNPMRFPQVRKDRYERAVDWLKAVQKGDIIPDGLPLKVDTAGNTGGASSIEFTYETKRTNAF